MNSALHQVRFYSSCSVFQSALQVEFIRPAVFPHRPAGSNSFDRRCFPIALQGRIHSTSGVSPSPCRVEFIRPAVFPHRPVGSNSFDQRCFIVICDPDTIPMGIVASIPDQARSQRVGNNIPRNPANILILPGSTVAREITSPSAMRLRTW